ncbi:MAG: hypothetical protein ACE5H8_14195 [Alphaproteobacteria bacterium]
MWIARSGNGRERRRRKKGVAPPGVRIQHIYRGIVPFVTLQLVGFGLVMAFPEIAMWLARALLD